MLVSHYTETMTSSGFRMYEQVLLIMMLSRLMSDCKQSDTRKFAAGRVITGANLLAAQSAYSDFPCLCAGDSGSARLRRSESSYPLRT